MWIILTTQWTLSTKSQNKETSLKPWRRSIEVTWNYSVDIYSNTIVLKQPMHLSGLKGECHELDESSVKFHEIICSYRRQYATFRFRDTVKLYASLTMMCFMQRSSAINNLIVHHISISCNLTFTHNILYIFSIVASFMFCNCPCN